MEKTITRITTKFGLAASALRTPAGRLALTAWAVSTLTPAAALAQDAAELSLQYLYTFGSRQGIHPPGVLHRRPGRAIVGSGEHPYGLGFPSAVTTDLRHRVWIADSGTASVHVFDLETGAYREFKRCGNEPLQIPWGLAADRAGRVYLTDAGTGEIFVFDEKGEFDHSLFAHHGRPLERPGAIALSADEHTIYVADPPRNVVVELDREGEVNGVIRLPPELSDPASVSIADNQVYVLGNREHRVVEFSPSGVPRGELRWNGVPFPSALAFDARHRLFLVGNPRWMVVQAFDLTGHNVAAFGQMGDAVDQTRRIDGIFADPRGRVFVLDAHNGKVVVFGDLPTGSASRGMGNLH